MVYGMSRFPVPSLLDAGVEGLLSARAPAAEAVVTRAMTTRVGYGDPHPTRGTRHVAPAASGSDTCTPSALCRMIRDSRGPVQITHFLSSFTAPHVALHGTPVNRNKYEPANSCKSSSRSSQRNGGEGQTRTDSQPQCASSSQQHLGNHSSIHPLLNTLSLVWAWLRAARRDTGRRGRRHTCPTRIA